MNVEDIHWYGHDSFRIEDAGRQVYIDPWKIPAGAPKADLVLVTHDHYDHYSEDDVARLSTADTTIIGPPDVAEKVASGIAKSQGAEAVFIEAGRTVEAAGLKVTAVPAYNVGKKFHPKSSGWVGYLLTLSDGTTLYHAGDTDHVPEMDSLRVDVALLPVSGTYVMTAAEAVEAANRMKPKVAIPMHYGDIVGSAADAETFAEGFTGQTVIKQAET